MLDENTIKSAVTTMGLRGYQLSRNEEVMPLNVLMDRIKPKDIKKAILTSSFFFRNNEKPYLKNKLILNTKGHYTQDFMRKLSKYFLAVCITPQNNNLHTRTLITTIPYATQTLYNHSLNAGSHFIDYTYDHLKDYYDASITLRLDKDLLNINCEIIHIPTGKRVRSGRSVPLAHAESTTIGESANGLLSFLYREAMLKRPHKVILNAN